MLEKALKENCKGFLIMAVIFGALACLFVGIGLTVNPNGEYFSYRIHAVLYPYHFYIIGGVLFAVTVMIIIAFVLKVSKVNRFINSYDMNEINRAIHDPSGGCYPKMSIFVTDKLLISAKSIEIVEISNIRNIEISITASVLNIKMNLWNGQSTTFCAYNVNGDIEHNPKKLQVLNELSQFKKKIKQNFPNIDIYSEI